MADSPVIARAYVQIVPSMQGSQSEITKELTGVTDAASESAGSTGGSKFGNSFANAIKGATAAIGAAMAVATGAVIATGKAFVDATSSAATYGDEVDKQSQKMGISTQAYQEWNFVMQHCGTSMDSLRTSMKTLATAAETGNEAFAALGLTQEQIASMSQEELFAATIEGLQNVEDTTERTYLAGQLLGRGATELGALLNMSAEDTAEMKTQLSELGGLMSEQSVKDAAAYQDALQNMETSMTGLKNRMMSEFLPGMTKAMDGLSKVFSGDNSGIGQISSGIEETIATVTNLLPQFLPLAESIILSLLSGFAPMLPQITTTIFNVLIQAITMLTTMIPQMMPSIILGIQGLLMSLFQALPVIFNGLNQLLVSIISWIASDENVQQFVDGIVQLTTIMVEGFAQILPVLLPAIVKIIGEVVLALTKPENVEMLVGAVLSLASAIFVALVDCVPVLIEFVIGLFENLGGLLGSFLSWIVPIVANGIGVVVNTVKNWGNSIKNFISNLWNSITTGVRNFITNIKNGFINGFNTIKNNISNIINSVKNLVTNIINGIGQLPSLIYNIGRNVVVGLWNGIRDIAGWCLNKIYDLGDSIVNAVKGIFGVHSPSRVFASIGNNLALGLGIGYEEGIEDIKDDMLDSSNGITTSMTAEVSAYSANGGLMETGSTTNNNSSISINVYGAEGQNVNDLAEQIAIRLENMTQRRGAVYG